MESSYPVFDPDAHIAKLNKAMLRDDAQEFMQVLNLTNSIESPKVWYRYLGGDFMAEIRVLRPGRKRPRRVWATAESRAGALEALASKVAAIFYPPVSSV